MPVITPASSLAIMSWKGFFKTTARLPYLIKKQLGVISLPNDTVFDEIEQECFILEETTHNCLLHCNEYVRQCLSLSNKNKTLVKMFKDLLSSSNKPALEEEWKETCNFYQQMDLCVGIIKKNIIKTLERILFHLKEFQKKLKKRKRKLIDVQRKKGSKDLEKTMEEFERYNKPLQEQATKMFFEIRELFSLLLKAIDYTSFNLFNSFKQDRSETLKELKESWKERTSFSSAILNKICSLKEKKEIPYTKNIIQRKTIVLHDIFLSNNVCLEKGQSIDATIIDSEVAQLNVSEDSIIVPLSCLSLDLEKD